MQSVDQRSFHEKIHNAVEDEGDDDEGADRDANAADLEDVLAAMISGLLPRLTLRMSPDNDLVGVALAFNVTY